MKKQTNSQKITQNRRILARRATLELSNDALRKVAGGATTYSDFRGTCGPDDCDDKPEY